MYGSYFGCFGCSAGIRSRLASRFTTLDKTSILTVKCSPNKIIFSVRSDTVLSPITKINTGILQGTVIAPVLLFLNVADQATNTNIIVQDFSDDKALLATHYVSQIAAQYIQVHLDLFYLWYNEWVIKINESKSGHCSFTQRSIDCTSYTSIANHFHCNKTPATYE